MKKAIAVFVLVAAMVTNKANADALTLAVMIDQTSAIYTQLATMYQQLEYSYQQVQMMQRQLESIKFDDIAGTLKSLDNAAMYYNSIERNLNYMGVSIDGKKYGIKEIYQTPGAYIDYMNKLQDKDFTREEERRAWNYLGYTGNMETAAKSISGKASDAAAWITGNYIKTREQLIEASNDEAAERVRQAVSKLGGASTDKEVSMAQLEVDAETFKLLAEQRRLIEEMSLLLAAQHNQMALYGMPIVIGATAEGQRQFTYSEAFIEGGSY